jgi:hypothetical protein
MSIKRFAFQKPDTWVRTLLKREGTVLTKILLRYGAALGAPIGGRLTGADVVSGALVPCCSKRMWL